MSDKKTLHQIRADLVRIKKLSPEEYERAERDYLNPAADRICALRKRLHA